MKLLLCFIALLSLSACSSFSFKNSNNPQNDVPQMDAGKKDITPNKGFFSKETLVESDSSGNIRKDLNFMCRVRKEQVREGEKANADKAILAYKAAQKLEDNFRTETMKKALEATAVMDPKKIPEAWDQLARETDNASWSCPALTELNTP